jgi:hypothetical protein
VGAAAKAVVRVAERVPVDQKTQPVMKTAYAAFRRVYPATRAIYTS